MTHRIDAPMDAVKPSREHAASYRFFPGPDPTQLTSRDHSVLPSGDLPNRRVDSGDFPVHIKG